MGRFAARSAKAKKTDHTLRNLVQEFGWVHTGIGLFGNATFLAGSVFFLPAFEAWKTLGVWLFIAGASLMLLGSLGDMLVKVYEARDKSRESELQVESRQRPEERAAA